MQAIGQQRDRAIADPCTDFDRHGDERQRDDDQRTSFAAASSVLLKGMIVLPGAQVVRVHGREVSAESEDRGIDAVYPTCLDSSLFLNGGC